MGCPLVLVESEEKALALKENFDHEINTIVVRNQPVRAVYSGNYDQQDGSPPCFKFTVVPAESKVVGLIQEQLKDEVFIAFDNDQRGEYLSWLMGEYITSVTNGATLPKRLYVSGVEKEEIIESCKILETVEPERPLAFHIRSLFQMHLGKYVQRNLGTKAGPENLPLTLESISTLFLLEERETENQMHIPSLKWQVHLKLKNKDDKEFEACLEEAYGVTDDSYFRDGDQAKEVIQRFRNSPIKATKKSATEFEVNPPGPYRLIDLVVDVFGHFGISFRKTLSTVKKLYHGVQVDGKRRGLISSPMPVENSNYGPMIIRLQSFIKEKYGDEALGSLDLDTDVSDDMIFPLCPVLEAEGLGENLDDDEVKIYSLIRGRGIACLMKAACGENLELELGAGGEFLFKAISRKIKDKGYLLEYHAYPDKDLVEPSPFDTIEEGDTIGVVHIFPEQTGGFPPEYYTVESLFGDLTDFAIEFDTLTLSMLQQMIDSGYVKFSPDGVLRPLSNTGKVVSTLNRAFPGMAGINLSAYIAQTIEEAVSRRKALDFALKQFDQSLMMHGKVLVKVALPSRLQQRKSTSRHVIKVPSVPTATAPPKQTKSDIPQKGQTDTPDPGEEAPLLYDTELPESSITKKKFVPPSEESMQEEVSPEVKESSTEMQTETQASEGESVAEHILGEESVSLEMEEAPEQDEKEKSASDSNNGLQAENSVKVFDEKVPSEDRQDSAEQLAQIAKEAPGPKKDCPDCGKAMILKDDRYGKYWSCSAFPRCRHAETYGAEEAELLTCPLCKTGDVLKKLTPTGKPFFVCLEKACEFMAWSQPHSVPCQVCNSPFLIEKKNISGKIYLRCPRAGCNYMESLSGEDDEDIAGPALQLPEKKKRLVRVRKGSGGSKSGGKRKVRVVRRK